MVHFLGSLFGPTFGPLFVTFLRHPYRGLPRCSKGIQSGYRRWSKTGHLRVPKTPILTKNGDFWTKTPRGSPELGTPQKPLFWGFLKIGQKAVIFGSKFGPSEKGPKKGSFLGIFRRSKMAILEKWQNSKAPSTKHFFRFFRIFFVFFWSFLSIFGGGSKMAILGHFLGVTFWTHFCYSRRQKLVKKGVQKVTQNDLF